MAGELDLLLPLAGLRQVAEVYGWPRGMVVLAGEEDEEGGDIRCFSTGNTQQELLAPSWRAKKQPKKRSTCGDDLGLKHAEPNLVKLYRS